MAESNEDYFRRRHDERSAEAEVRTLDKVKSQQRWQTQLDALVERYDSDVKGLLTAFASEAPEMVDYEVRGPEETGQQLNWSIEYSRGEGLPKKTILVVLRYLMATGVEGAGEFVPDCFSLEGLLGLTTIKPPTIEALRKALGDATFRP